MRKRALIIKNTFLKGCFFKGEIMKELFLNFKKRIEKDPSLVEALCLSDKNGLIWSEHYTMNAKRNIYSQKENDQNL